MSGIGENEYGEFDIKLWCKSSNITESGLKKIETNAVDDLETLLLFKENDVELLKLSAGDALRFRLAIQKLHKLADAPPQLTSAYIDPTRHTVSKSIKTEEKLYTQSEVQRLLAGEEAVAAGSEGSYPAYPAVSAKAETKTISQVRELMRDLLDIDDLPLNARGEKALLPVNFLSCIRGTQDSDEVIHSGKGLNLVLQSTGKRITPEKLTVGQWIGANARILDRLVTSGKLNSSNLTDYLDYTRKIGDLLQLFTPSSVFTLDNCHRLELHEDPTKRWNLIDSTLQAAHLRRKDADAKFQNPSFSNFAGGNHGYRRGGGQQRKVHAPCWAYNSAEGCKYPKDRCRYEHTDSLDSPARQTERAPRFQRNSSNLSITGS